MRVLFVYPAQIKPAEQPLGLMYVSAVLKQYGHETRLFHLTREEDSWFEYRLPAIEERFVRELTIFSPQVVGFSMIVTIFNRAKTLAELVKQYSNAMVVFGGAGPTVEPERMLVDSGADMVCVGEGEYAMLDVVTALEEGGDLTCIPNIWTRVDGRIFSNDVRPLIEDLERLPWPDRELIRENFQSGDIKWASFVTARGCPYHCTYCHNPYLRELYKGKGRYVRFRKLDNVIAEIKDVVARYNPPRVTFSDDTFTLNKQRIMEFCRVYASEVALPFQCQTRANHLDSEVCQALKDAGCVDVHIGIEAGNDYIRNQIWEKNLSQEDIVRAFSQVREIGLKTGSFNIIGAPYEREENIWETIDLNCLIRPDKLDCTIFMPLSGSKAKRICEEQGWSMRPLDASYFCEVFLEQPSISPRKLLSYQEMFDLYVYGNKLLYPLFHTLRALREYYPEGRKLHHRIYRTAVHQSIRLLKRLCVPA